MAAQGARRPLQVLKQRIGRDAPIRFEGALSHLDEIEHAPGPVCHPHVADSRPDVHQCAPRRELFAAVLDVNRVRRSVPARLANARAEQRTTRCTVWYAAVRDGTAALPSAGASMRDQVRHGCC